MLAASAKDGDVKTLTPVPGLDVTSLPAQLLRAVR
jgi:hypothetical protein